MRAKHYLAGGCAAQQLEALEPKPGTPYLMAPETPGLLGVDDIGVAGS
jgi:hypothetical protein